MPQNQFSTINPELLHPYGTIRRTHGHQGSVIITVLSDELYQLDPQFLFIVIDEIPIPFEVIEMRGSKEQLITTFWKVETLTDAEKLVGHRIMIHEEELPDEDISESETDLVGYTLAHPTLQKVGTIIHLDESTANLLLTIEEPDGNRVMIPLVEEWITDLDSKSRKLTLNFPPDLLSL